MKKILPPFLFVLFVFAMGLTCWWTGSNHQLPYPYYLLGVPIVIAGLVLAKSGKKLFTERSVNVMTFDDPTGLVTDGVFKYTRNPMYLGFVIAMLGFAVIMGASLSSLLLTLVFFVITDRWYVVFEEKKMRAKFGEDYEAYCQNVRRWI